MLVEESIKSAVSSIKTNGVRSFLTALAIIIGTAAVITVIGIGSSAESPMAPNTSETNRYAVQRLFKSHWLV